MVLDFLYFQHQREFCQAKKQEKSRSEEKLYLNYGNFMSRIGKQEIQIPKGVQVTKSGAILKVVGPKGTLTKNFSR